MINKTVLTLNFCTSIHNKVKFVSISKFIRFKELPKNVFRLMLIYKYKLINKCYNNLKIVKGLLYH